MFQQFWALGIQVQSYVVFPLIALIAAAVARFVRGSGRRVLLLTSATVAILSFTYSVLLTASNQPTAYFHLGTRLWEFLAGTMLALILVKVRLRPVVASVLGWTGLAVVLGFAAFVDHSPLLPGALALVPVLAAGAVIASARAGAAPRVLTLRPVLWFAESSFAFYLWHWPILVCYQWFVSQSVSWKAGLAILLLAGVLAVATTKLVEQPLRNSPRLLESALATVVACLMLFVPVAAALVVWSTADAVKRDSDWKAVAAVLAGEPVREGEVVPSTTIAAKDLSQAYARNCQQSSRVHIPKPCEWGDPDGELTIALVGGSHDTQWVDAVARTAEGLNARMISITKGSCPFGDVRNSELNPAAACVTWNAAVLDQLIVDPPDLVITSATRTQKGVEEIPEWKTTYLSRLSDAGIEVIGIRDNPRMGRGVLTCLETSDAAECTVPRSGLLSDHLEVPALEHFTLVDLTDLICDASVCSPVTDGVLVTWDGSHLTRTWTLLNSGELDQAIASVLTGATA